MPAIRTILKYSWLVLVVAAIPAAAGTSRIYITNSAGDAINVIDPETNTVVQNIKGIEAAHGINFSPDGTRVYVSNESDSTLDVFDQKSGSLLKKVPLSNHPNNITVAKEFVSVVDATTYQVVWDYQFDLGVRPMTIEANADGSTKRIFVQLAAFDGFAVLVFAKHDEVARIKLPDLHTGVDMDAGRLDAPSHGIGVHPDGKTLWVTSIPQNAVFVYSLADLKLINQITLPE